MKRIGIKRSKGLKIRRDPLDALFSKYVRMKAGWKCERCGNKPDPDDPDKYIKGKYGHMVQR